jgi:hypothetical protein
VRLAKKTSGLRLEMALTGESMFIEAFCFGRTVAVVLALAAALMAAAMAIVTAVAARIVLSATVMTMITVWSLHRPVIGRSPLLAFSLIDVHCLQRVSFLYLLSVL